MTATRTRRTSARHTSRARKLVRAGKPAAAARPAKLPRPAPAVPEQVLYRFCKAGWAVLVERQPNAQGTRFVCPFCMVSHRVSGPVRGFRKVRRAQWIKLRRVEE